jgi:hypothetical protein
MSTCDETPDDEVDQTMCGKLERFTNTVAHIITAMYTSPGGTGIIRSNRTR